MATWDIFPFLARAGALVATGDFAAMADLFWLRWHRLDFQYGRYVSAEDGNAHEHSARPMLARILATVRIPEESVALDLGSAWESRR